MQGNAAATSGVGFFLTLPQWLSVIAMLAVVTGAIFGLLALFTETKVNGKVTKFGRWAAVGILISACFSIAARILQDRLEVDRAAAAAKAERERQADEKTRFETQLGKLNFLETQMRVSLKEQTAQQRLQQKTIDRAEAALRETVALSNQEERNTGRLVLALWNETNRVTANSIVAKIETSCQIKPEFNAVPLLPLGSSVGLSVYNNKYFDSGLEPSHQSFTQWRNGNRLVQRNTYTTFDGVSPYFSDIRNWVGAEVRFQVVFNHQRGTVAAFRKAALGGPTLPLPGHSSSWSHVEQVPCSIRLILLINDRIASVSEGVMFQDVDSGEITAGFSSGRLSSYVMPQLPTRRTGTGTKH